MYRRSNLATNTLRAIVLLRETRLKGALFVSYLPAAPEPKSFLMHLHLTFSGLVYILPLKRRREHCPFTTRLRVLKFCKEFFVCQSSLALAGSLTPLSF